MAPTPVLADKQHRGIYQMFSRVRALGLGALAVVGVALVAGFAYEGYSSNGDYKRVQQMLQDQQGLNAQLRLMVSSVKRSQSMPGEGTPGSAYCYAVPYAVSVKTAGAAVAGVYDLMSVDACTERAESVSQIVFRFEVTDQLTGQPVTAADGVALKVVAPNGAESGARFSQGTSSEWSAAWDVPFGFAMGAGEYRIEITAGPAMYAPASPVL